MNTKHITNGDEVLPTGFTKRETIALEALIASIRAMLGDPTIAAATLKGMTRQQKNLEEFLADGAGDFADALINRLNK